jgi:hypothetical protein
MLRVSGPPIRNVQGLEIYVTNQPSKTGKGRDRLWIHIRQRKSKKWRISASLCYVNGFDVRFEK